MQFVVLLTVFANKNCILQVMSLIVLPPPLCLTQLSLYEPAHLPPLSVSDMIFECSLEIHSVWSYHLNDYFVAFTTRLIVEA